jgi:hypothetical protein
MEVGDIRFYKERWKAVEEIDRDCGRAHQPPFYSEISSKTAILTKYPFPYLGGGINGDWVNESLVDQGSL